MNESLVSFGGLEDTLESVSKNILVITKFSRELNDEECTIHLFNEELDMW